MQSGRHCLACKSNDLSIFYEIDSIPVHSVILHFTPDQAAKSKKGDLCLEYCHSCGFISNLAFDPDLHEYGSGYESTQSYSPTFGSFAYKQAADLIERYDLRGKTIIEIGCGNGEFLSLLCELGGNHGIGFDPAFKDGRIQTDADIKFVDDFYSEISTHYRGDIIVCKMTLEHIQRVDEFVGMIRRSLANSPDTIVYFQVPDVIRVLREMAFWDIYYEHCSYFSPGSLARLFRNNGFNILSLRQEYAQQYVIVEASLKVLDGDIRFTLEHDLSEISQLVTYFQANIHSRLKTWQDYITLLKADYKRTVLWGAGSKAVAFLTTLGITDKIEYCVDINPNKHGTFIAGTGQKVISPEFLRDYQPEVVIILNPIYKPEIDEKLKHMGLNAELITVNDI